MFLKSESVNEEKWKSENKLCFPYKAFNLQYSFRTLLFTHNFLYQVAETFFLLAGSKGAV